MKLCYKLQTVTSPGVRRRAAIGVGVSRPGGCRRLWEKRRLELGLRDWVLFRVMKMFWSMVTQPWEYARNYGLLQFKRVHFMVYDLHLHLKK